MLLKEPAQRNMLRETLREPAERTLEMRTIAWNKHGYSGPPDKDGSKRTSRAQGPTLDLGPWGPAGTSLRHPGNGLESVR
ncbi:unnamed protein product [Arctogadus glacialis]